MNRRAYIFYLTIFVFGFGIAYFCGLKTGMEEDLLYNEKTVDVQPKENEKKEEG